MYKISGRVTNGGQPAGGVKVKLEGSKATSTTTDASGRYAFTELRAGGTYTITPARARINFTPLSRSFNNLSHDGSADFTGVGELDSKPISECTLADESRERRNIIGMYDARWTRSIEGERPRIIAAIVRDGERAEAVFGRLEPQIIFFNECKVAYVTIRYVWQIHTFFNGRPARVLNVPKQGRLICTKMGGWLCT